MRTKLLVTLIIIIAGICSSCQTKTIIKQGMTEYEVVEILNSEDCEEIPQQTLRIRDNGKPFIDHYYQLPNEKYMLFGFEGNPLLLTEIKYLGEYHEGQGIKFIHGFDWEKAVDLEEVNIADYK